MLCEEQLESLVYWPTVIGESEGMNMGGIRVVLVNEVNGGVEKTIMRKLRLSARGLGGKEETRMCWQIQYTGWPDSCAPESTNDLFELKKLVDNAYAAAAVDGSGEVGTLSPLVVHCFAGCGRTGAYIAFDSLVDCFSGAEAGIEIHIGDIACSSCDINLMSTTPRPSPFSFHRRSLSGNSFTSSLSSSPSSPSAFAFSSTHSSPQPTLSTHAATRVGDLVLHAVHHLRSQRVRMVQTLPQFLYLYDVILDSVTKNLNASK